MPAHTARSLVLLAGVLAGLGSGCASTDAEAGGSGSASNGGPTSASSLPAPDLAAPGLEEMLQKTQDTRGTLAGSWDPVGGDATNCGRVYSSALMALTLQVVYRYAAALGLGR